MKNAVKRVFTCKNRCRYSRKRATFCRNFAKNWQLPRDSDIDTPDIVDAAEGREVPEGPVPVADLLRIWESAIFFHATFLPTLFPSNASNRSSNFRKCSREKESFSLIIPPLQYFDLAVTLNGWDDYLVATLWRTSTIEASGVSSTLKLSWFGVGSNDFLRASNRMSQSRACT